MPRPRNSLPAGGPPRRDRDPDELVIVPLRVTAHDRDRLHDLASRSGTSVTGLLASVRDTLTIETCADCPWTAGDECDHPRTPETSIHHGQVATATHDRDPPPSTCPLQTGAMIVRIG